METYPNDQTEKLTKQLIKITNSQQFPLFIKKPLIPETYDKTNFVAKSLKALNHEGHEGKEKLFFVLFVSFVVPFFSEPFATPSCLGKSRLACIF